jgi:hypothetical protein
MLTVVATVCAMASPFNCKDVRIVSAIEQVSPFQCMYLTQFSLAAWKEENPGWRIQDWYCGPVKQVARI